MLKQLLQRADKQLAELHDEDGTRFDFTLNVIARAHELALEHNAAEAARVVENITGPLSPNAGRRLLAVMLATQSADKPDTLSVAQAAERLKVSPDTVTGWIHSGTLKASNVGKGKQRGRYRIAAADLDNFMAARQCEKPATRQPRKRRASYQRDFS